MCIHTHAPTHLVIDTNGHVPANTTDPSLEPARLFDSRPGHDTIDDRFAGTGQLTAGQTVTIDIAGRGGVDPDAVAAFLNVTAVTPTGPGFLTVYPCDTPRPLASNVNYQPGDVTPNAVLAKLATNGTVCIHTHAPTHLVIDTNGQVEAT